MMAYESQPSDLAVRDVEIKTPFETGQILKKLPDNICIASILRAREGMVTAHEALPFASIGHIWNLSR